MNAKKATNKDCFAYDRGNCRSLSDPNCEGCKFFKHKSDNLNNIKMIEYNRMSQLMDSTNQSRNTMRDKGG